MEKYLSPGDLHKLCSSVEMGAICSWKREKKAPCIKYKVCILSLSRLTEQWIFLIFFFQFSDVGSQSGDHLEEN